MTHYAFDFAGETLQARASGALFWPARAALVVADLHLGKAARMAARGGALLPPWGDDVTLSRLADEIAATGARCVVSLGDGFDDDATDRLTAPARATLDRLGAQADWLWIAGNHDARAEPPFGTTLPQARWGALTLRHIAEPGDGPDLSGHYHPKARLAGRSRPAFLIGAQHLILPAFGAFTGGMAAQDDPLRSLIGPGIAVLTGARALAVPLQPSRS